MGQYLHHLIFLKTYKWAQINQSVALNNARKACQGQTLQLGGPIHKLQRKIGVVNMAPGVVFTTLLFLQNIQMYPISQRVTAHKAIKACQGQTLQLGGPIHKLQRKLSVVNMGPEVVFTRIHISQSSQMDPISQSVAYTRLERLARNKHSSLVGKTMCCKYSPYSFGHVPLHTTKNREDE